MNNFFRDIARRENRSLVDRILALDEKHIKSRTKNVLKSLTTVKGIFDDYVEVEYWRLSLDTGIPVDEIWKFVKDLDQKGFVSKYTEPATGSKGKRISKVYLKLNEIALHPEEYVPAKMRNHGGARIFCPECGSENVTKKKKTVITLTCQCCGHKENAEYEVTPGMTHDEEMLREAIAMNEAGISYARIPEIAEDVLNYEPPSVTSATTSNIDELVSFFLEVAGVGDKHSVMNVYGEAKYTTVQHRVCREDAEEHIFGQMCIATELKCPQGMTRMVIYDADDEGTWKELAYSATLLAGFGYKPILEPSPNRGGHLVVVFSERVSWEAAIEHMTTIAPSLKSIKEHWPSERKQNVRLPGARYKRDDIDSWCPTYSADGELLGTTGTEVWTALLNNQTSADIVPECEVEFKLPVKKREVTHDIDARPDAFYAQRYANNSFELSFNDTGLCAWAKDRYSVGDIVETERNGHALASWRGEGNPSVALYHDTNTFCDFGGFKDNGSYDGGDVIELMCRAEDKTRSEVMRELGRQFRTEALAALKDAAQAGEPIPSFIEKYAVLTQKGLDYYRSFLPILV